MKRSGEDGQNAGRLGPLSALPVEPAAEYLDWQGPEEASDPQPTAIPAKAAPDRATLSEIELRFLRVVVEHPALPSGKYAPLAHIGTHQAVAIRENLVNRGYLREHRVNTRTRGRTAIILEPLPAAASVVGASARGGAE